MFEFKIIKKSKKSRARAGILKTSHGEIETPAFVPVGTQAVIKTLTSEEAAAAGCQLLIANTFHLHLKPALPRRSQKGEGGEKIIQSAGGIHKFMNWNRPIMTDSGGFQVFSLGFGKDQGVGKILLNSEGAEQSGNQPKEIKITDKGVYFRSPIDGRKLFLGPKESMKIQQNIGADIMFAFDECTSPLAGRKYVEKSLEKTHKWAEICIKEFRKQPSLKLQRPKQALFGITQGSRFKDLREESAKFINSLGFDGYGIGGDLGTDKNETKKILNWTMPYLDENKPRHLLGIGHLEDMEMIIKGGVDTFDCTVPTHYARRGIAFTSSGRLDMRQSKFLSDPSTKLRASKNPLDKKCDCEVCKNYKRNYISHLIRAKEITGLKLLTFHNLYFFNKYVENLRKKILAGKI